MYRERRASGVADKENVTGDKLCNFKTFYNISETSSTVLANSYFQTVLLCAYIGIGGEQEPHLLDIQDKVNRLAIECALDKSLLLMLLLLCAIRLFISSFATLSHIGQ